MTTSKNGSVAFLSGSTVFRHDLRSFLPEDLTDKADSAKTCFMQIGIVVIDFYRTAIKEAEEMVPFCPQ